MGKYKSYAERFDVIAKKNFEAYQAAEKRLKAAADQRSKNPVRSGWGVTLEQRIEAQKAAMAYDEAYEAFKQAKQALTASLSDVSKLHQELQTQLDKDLMADPAKLDGSTVALLQSGICSPKEIAAMYDQAEQAGNTTLQRYIGQFAANEEARIRSKSMDVSAKTESRIILSSVAEKGKRANGLQDHPAMIGFNTMKFAYERCTANPALMTYWDELTENPKEAM